MFRKKVFWIVLAALTLAVSGAACLYYNNVYLQAQEPVEPTVATAQVRRGDLIITADGAGTLVPASEVNLGFRSGGVLTTVVVEVGDQVEAGQVLALLDETDIQAQVAQAEINLRLAELKLAELAKEADPAGLAAAQASLASARADLHRLTKPPTDEDLAAAQENLLSAQQGLNTLLAGPASEEIAIAKADLELAEINVQKAQTDYDKIAWRENVGATPQAVALQQATIAYGKAKANYDLKTAGPSAEQISAARAKVAQAQDQVNTLQQEPDSSELAAAEAKVAQAQAQLDSLLAGASTEDLQSAELGVTQALNNLKEAQRKLEDTLLVASTAGTVLAVKAEPGESVGTGAIITLADLEEPEVLFWVEETDLMSVAPGNCLNIVFEALPDVTFPGEILHVDPALVKVDNTWAVQVWGSVDLTAHPVNLLSGMNAEVEIVAGEAKDALLVPLQALRETRPGQYAVFVVQPDGELELRMVEVGLRDFVNAEILSGLKLREVVSLGTTG